MSEREEREGVKRGAAGRQEGRWKADELYGRVADTSWRDRMRQRGRGDEGKQCAVYCKKGLEEPLRIL
jgi:hypothetical protein